MQKLEKWAPELLKIHVQQNINKLNQFKKLSKELIGLDGISENIKVSSGKRDALSQKTTLLAKKIKVLIRLGNNPEMEQVWKDLVNREMVHMPIDINLEDKVNELKLDRSVLIKYPIPIDQLERFLIENILLIISISAETDLKKKSTINEKEIEIRKLVRQVQKLMNGIDNSYEATKASDGIVESNLQKRFIDQSLNKSDPGLINSPEMQVKKGSSYMRTDLMFMPVDKELEWEKNQALVKLAWWSRESINLNLIELLQTFTDDLSKLKESYKVNHFKSQSSRIQENLSRMMVFLFGKPLHRHVALLVSTIKNMQISEEAVAKDYARFLARSAI